MAKVPPWNVWLADWSVVETNSRAWDWYSGVVLRVTNSREGHDDEQRRHDDAPAPADDLEVVTQLHTFLVSLPGGCALTLTGALPIVRMQAARQ